MKKPLILAAVCIFALPFISSSIQTQSNEFVPQTPFAAVALAGHTTYGGWCECGSSLDCICDPGERPNSFTRQGTQDYTKPPASPTQEEGVDFGTAALMLVFFALTLSRLRG